MTDLVPPAVHTFPDQRHDDVVELCEGGLVLSELHVVEGPVPRHVRSQGTVLSPVVLATLEEFEPLVWPLCQDGF